MAADYLLQEDGSSKLILEDASGDVILESSTASSGPAATVSVTEAADTLSSVATVATNASLSATEAADTLAASSAAAIRASLAATEAADTMSASGTVSTVAGPSASLSATEAADTQVSAGTVAVVASLSATESADTMSGVAQIQISASFSATEEADTFSGAASSGGALTASFAATEEDDSSSWVGTNENPNASAVSGGAPRRRRRTLRILPDQRMVYADDREIVEILRSFYKQEEKVPFKTREQVESSVPTNERKSVHWKSYVAKGDLVEFDAAETPIPVPVVEDLRRVPKGFDSFARELTKRKQDEQDMEDIMRLLS